MSVTPTARQTVLEEVFDENSKPSYEEIKDYGLRIGVDLDKEPNLYDLAREGLMQPLPPEWKPVRDNDTDQIYYFNFKTNKSQWEHPLDGHYRGVIKKHRSSSNSQTDGQDDDSRTSVKEDLKSYEEAASLSLKISDMQVTPLPPRVGRLEPLGGAIKKLNLSNVSEVKKRPNSSDIRNRRNIGPVEFRHLSKQDIMKTINKQDERSKDEGYGTEFSLSSAAHNSNVNQFPGKKELTLSGGGSAFLKSKTRLSPSGDLTSPSLSEGQDDGHRRGILREQKSVSRSDLSGDKKDDISIELDDDRKSVRFNLDKELKDNNSCTDDDSLTSSEHNKQHKQIEIDFEELEQNMKKQDKEEEKTLSHKTLKEMFERKSINIVLNTGKSYENKNLIDLSDDSSTVDSQKPTPRTDSNVQKMKSLFENKTRQKTFDLEDDVDLTETKLELKYLEDLEDKIKLDSDVRQNKLFSLELKKKDLVLDVNNKTGCENKQLEFSFDKKLIDFKSKSFDEKVKDVGTYEIEDKKKEKLKELQLDFDEWSVVLKESYSRKKEETSLEMEQKYKKWLEVKEDEIMTRSKEEFEVDSQRKLTKLLEDVKEDMLKKEAKQVELLRKQLEQAQNERLGLLKIEIEEEEQKEMMRLKKTFEEELLKKKEQMMQKHKEELIKIEKNLENVLSDQRCQKILELDIARENEAAIEVMRLEMKENYQKQKNNLTKEHETLLENLRQQHVMTIEQMKIDLRSQEESLRKCHQNRLEELKSRLNKDVDRKSDTPRSDVSDTRVYEKVRCEKRLLEDKYKTLKEKYIRLKTDVKMSLDRKHHKKEAATTGSETEKSSSHKANVRKYDEERKAQQLKLKKQLTNMDNAATKHSHGGQVVEKTQTTATNGGGGIVASSTTTAAAAAAVVEETETTSSEDGRAGSRRRRQLLSKLKAASTSKLNGSVPQTDKTNDKEETLSPVESLRRQLRKLEEIEDQFPVATHADTYLRYPFTESTQFGSSELEFFRHRIHLERDSVRRAKEFLKAQKKCFENRQTELKQRLSEGGPRVRGVVEQIYQEEKELTDMEVSVHRTRSLLGEKIIRLRHLEQSLRRLSRGRSRSKERDDGTLSDLSSHSGSSGFSSTDFNNSDVVGAKINYDQNRRRFETNMQESSEIIHSLENLNLEIKEIWEVLKKQHQSGQGGTTVLPPPPLVYSDLGWPTRAGSNIHRPLAQQYMTQVKAGNHLGHVTTTVVDSSLVERTKSLRNWLRTARNNGNTVDLLSAVNQVTL